MGKEPFTSEEIKQQREDAKDNPLVQIADDLEDQLQFSLGYIMAAAINKDVNTMNEVLGFIITQVRTTHVRLEVLGDE